MPQLTKVSADVAEELLRDLRKEEEALAEADTRFRQALAMFQLAVSRYSAVRDAVQLQLGRNPYEPKVVQELWPPMEKTGHVAWDHPAFGRYQYLGKKVGDAVIDALRHLDRPLTLDELTEELDKGGLKVGSRAVNASLMNLNGVTKGENGTYAYEEGPPPVDIDDLPF